MKFRYLLLALLMSTSALAAILPEVPLDPLSRDNDHSDGDEDRDRDRDRHDRDRPCRLKGLYSYEISGLVGFTSPGIVLNEVGDLFFDGRGEGRGSAVTVTNLAAPADRETTSQYSFTYSRLSKKVYLATGTATSDAGITITIRFVVSTGDCCEHISILALPNTTLIPIPTPPTLPPPQKGIITIK